jgi:hypothetical protein
MTCKRKTIPTVSALRKLHTSVRWNGEVYVTNLTIGCQSFVIAATASKREAQWFRREMAQALQTLLATEGNYRRDCAGKGER